MSKLKKTAWDWCSKYIRLRDALEFCQRMRIDLSQFNEVKDLIVKCCTCEKILPWIRMDAGHFIGRGLGGGSGVYFDERNIHAQCKQCNGFMQGNGQVYQEFIRNKYGDKVIIELLTLHKLGKKLSRLELKNLGEFYKGRFQELSNSI